MKHKLVYIILLTLTVALLVFPALQQHAKLFDFKPLNGVSVATQRPTLTVKSFMSGSYQQQEEQYLSENIGFREVLIRYYNQLTWSLFRQSQHKDIRVGKEKWLFDEAMVKNHDRQLVYDYGESNDEVLRRMKASAIMVYQLQEVLKEQGIAFFVCLPPCKDRVCEAYLDQKERKYNRPPGVVALDFYPPLFDSLGINYLDLSKHYMQIKDTVSYPLYLKTSFHWSLQSACYTADTLVRYMEALSGLNMHNLSFSEPYLSATRNPDADLEELMNLVWPIETDENYYVDVMVDDDTTAVKPSWLVVGDSYYWEWQYSLPLDQMFDAHHFWYYGNSVFDDPMHSNVKEVDLLRELLSTDVVMLMYSANNLYDLNRNFLTNALFAFYYDKSEVDAKIEKIKQDIRNTPEWFASIEQKALDNGQEVEVVLEDNARYVLYGTPGNYFEEFQQAQVPSCRSSRVPQVLYSLHDTNWEAYRTKIYENADWLSLIQSKADTLGITLDEAIDRDIEWLLQEAQ